MGLFDSIIGNANEEVEPMSIETTIVDETANVMPNDITGTAGLSGTGDAGTAGTGDAGTAGTGDDGSSGAGTGSSGSGSGGSGVGDVSILSGDIVPNIDIGGNIGMDFFGTESIETPSAISVEPASTIASSDATVPLETSVVDFGTPSVLEPALIQEAISTIEIPTEVSVLPPEEVVVADLDTNTTCELVSEQLSVPTPLDSIINLSTSVGVPTQGEAPESLDDKITEFVSELEELKAEDEVLLKQKEAEIAELEKETSALEKEVRKIHAEEKKIDTAIGSLTGKIK